MNCTKVSLSQSFNRGEDLEFGKQKGKQMNTIPAWRTYKQVSIFASVLCLTLFAVLMLCPAVIYWLFNVDGNATADFIGRRASILFFGLAMLTFLGRNDANTAARQTIATSLFIIMAGLACLGTIELLRGAVGSGILIAVLGEVLFASLYLPFVRKNLSTLS